MPPRSDLPGPRPRTALPRRAFGRRLGQRLGRRLDQRLGRRLDHHLGRHGGGRVRHLLRLWWPVLALLAVAAVALHWQAPSTGPDYAVPAAELAAARAQLDRLEVSGRAPLTGYERAQFGEGWADLDADGCSTREDVLRRDLTGVELDGCRVVSGLLHDPYGGKDIAFSRQDAAAVQIDHVVALADAWQKGAQAWSPTTRLSFANDPLNLVAVSGPLNQAKGAGDAATWLPPARSYRCPYVIRQIAVKARYALRVTAAERDAMSRELGRCRTVRTPGAGA